MSAGVRDNELQFSLYMSHLSCAEATVCSSDRLIVGCHCRAITISCQCILFDASSSRLPILCLIICSFSPAIDVYRSLCVGFCCIVLFLVLGCISSCVPSCDGVAIAAFFLAACTVSRVAREQSCSNPADPFFVCSAQHRPRQRILASTFPVVCLLRPFLCLAIFVLILIAVVVKGAVAADSTLVFLFFFFIVLF